MTVWYFTWLALRLDLFDIALWCDPVREQQRARVVLGRSGLIKNAFGPL